ncbi:AEC family transporter [Fructobacillus cardui]|uniref:AEC family transporter n=1 Tax=Fructobacillus cardui TaxID=2893170 RepID=UPI003D341914
MTSITMTIALPLLAFTAFLTPLNHQTLVQSMDVLIWGLIIYVILIVTMPFLYGRYDKDQRDVLGVLTAFGSTTFFGMPIAGAVYGAKGDNVCFRFQYWLTCLLVLLRLHQNVRGAATR